MPEQLSSPATTGRWELALDEIAKGKQDPERFMEGIRRLTAFLTDFARTNNLSAAFPEDPARKSRHTSKPSGTLHAEMHCPVCGHAGLRETELAFSCAAKDCHMTLWKDCLTRGGGPVLTEKLLSLLL